MIHPIRFELKCKKLHFILIKRKLEDIQVNKFTYFYLKYMCYLLKKKTPVKFNSN